MHIPRIPLHRLMTRPELRRIAVPAGIVGFALLGSVSLFATAPAPKPEPLGERAWPVSVIDVRPEAARPAFTGFGRVESTRHAALGTDLSLRVREVRVREGDWAAEGEVLVELDAAEIELLLAQRRADLAQASAELQALQSEQAMLESTLAQVRSMHALNTAKLERHQALRAKSLIAQSLVDEVQAQADQTAIQLKTHEHRLTELPYRLAAQQAVRDKAGALVELAELELDRTRIRAPFNGPILSVQASEGDRTQPGATLVEIAAADSYEIRVQVPASAGARFSRHLANGEPVSAVTTTAEGAALNLALVRVAGHVQPGQSGLDVFFALPPSTATLPPLGRTLDLEIRMPEEPDVVALPVSALYENDRIYAVEQNRLQAIDVQRIGESRGADGDLRILVRAPELSGGRRVITTQLPRAMAGLLVQAG